MATFTTLNLPREPDAAQPSYPRRYRDELPPEDERRSRFWLWFSILVLAVGLAGAAGYGLDRFERQANLLKGWGSDLSALRDRLKLAEDRLSTLPAQIASLRTDLAVLQKSFPQRLSTGLDQTRNSIRELGASLRREIRDTAADQRRATDARFASLEMERQAESERARQLEQQVASLSQRLAAVSEDLNHAQTSAALEEQRLSEQIRRTDGRVTEVANYNSRPRDRFEAATGKSVEIAPGFILHITRVDPRYRRFAGWLQLVNDQGRILWLRDQSMLQTVAFYTGENALRHDLIVTGLNSGGVSGYLVYPSKGETQPAGLVARTGG